MVLQEKSLESSTIPSDPPENDWPSLFLGRMLSLIFYLSFIMEMGVILLFPTPDLVGSLFLC